MRTIVLFAFALTSCCFAESSARDLFALVETTPHDAQSPNYRERLAAGQAAALSLLRMERPAGLSVAEWSRMTTLSERTLGWTLFQQRRFLEAIPILEKYLASSPADAEVSYWLGTAAVKMFEIQTDKELKRKYVDACLFHFARAAAYEGPGAMPVTARSRLNTFVRRTFEINYDSAGDSSPLLELISVAKNSALPPADFKIAASHR
jgi:hypothetical protein